MIATGPVSYTHLDVYKRQVYDEATARALAAERGWVVKPDGPHWRRVVAMARDIRVLVIKLADRLHNARTWKYVSATSAEKKAKETLEIYAPLAHRLGMNTIKWELEDLSFATLYPRVFEEIVRMVAERAPARDEYLTQVKQQVSDDLKAARITAVVSGRPKHYYSVYQKMIVRGRDFEDIYDLVAVRVLVDSVRDCYAALGAMHARWKPCLLYTSRCV